MKKIFMFLFAVCAIAACDPVEEDFSNDGHISVEELKSKSSVTLDKDASGQNGNVLTCTTSAAVNAKWTVDGKDLLGNYAWKKLKLGEHTVILTALCADGTELTAEYTVKCDVVTNALDRFWIYGEDPQVQPPFKPAAWNAANMRFSDNEGKFTDINGNEGFLPYLSDDVYWGFKTLIFDISEASDDCVMRVMNGWWANTYIEATPITNGLWELQLTEEIAMTCARGNGGEGKDLDLMLTSGSCQINGIYYEE